MVASIFSDRATPFVVVDLLGCYSNGPIMQNLMKIMASGVKGEGGNCPFCPPPPPPLLNLPLLITI